MNIFLSFNKYTSPELEFIKPLLGDESNRHLFFIQLTPNYLVDETDWIVTDIYLSNHQNKIYPLSLRNSTFDLVKNSSFYLRGDIAEKMWDKLSTEEEVFITVILQGKEPIAIPMPYSYIGPVSKMLTSCIDNM